MNNHNFELLLVKDFKTYWQVIGITYSNALKLEIDCLTLRATLFAIEDCKKALFEGKKITIAKVQEFSEVQPNDLIIEDVSELDRVKNIAINEVSARIHQAMFSISIIDLMDYLDCYMDLMNAGYCITDSNREDKYFEVIEDALENEEPEPINNDATFELEQEYILKKEKYNNALHNLNTLEKYLNCYDNLKSFKEKINIFTSIRETIKNSKTIDEIEENMKIFRSNLNNYNIVKDNN